MKYTGRGYEPTQPVANMICGVVSVTMTDNLDDQFPTGNMIILQFPVLLKTA